MGNTHKTVKLKGSDYSKSLPFFVSVSWSFKAK